MACGSRRGQSKETMMHSPRVYLTIALLLCGAAACRGASASPTPPPVPEAVEATPLPAPRVVKLEDGTYVEIRPGLESGFAHCCGDEQYRMEIECSDGLLRCYQQTGKRWKQTYGNHCESALDQQCYEQACTSVCDAYRELGPTRWREVIPK